AEMVLGSGVGGDGEWCRAVLVSGGGGWKQEKRVLASARKKGNSGSKCGLVKAKGDDGFTEVYYMLIKDAVDSAVEMRYKSDRAPRKVRAQVYAYYGFDILYHCLDTKRTYYWALLFRSDVRIALEELGNKILLRKTVMAVPMGAPLKIFATLYDIESEEWILDGICELSSLIEGNSKGRLDGTGCSLSLKVDLGSIY
nr:arginine--tRNA ligase, chloroplastic/mitochondrial [Tanacetum cinerariifolium]